MYSIHCSNQEIEPITNHWVQIIYFRMSLLTSVNWKITRTASLHMVEDFVAGMWRFSYEKKFGRVNDLRTPVEEKYSMECTRLEKDFFTEGNTYWMAIYPEDYRRIHNVVTKVTMKRKSTCSGGRESRYRQGFQVPQHTQDEGPMDVSLCEPSPGWGNWAHTSHQLPQIYLTGLKNPKIQ